MEMIRALKLAKIGKTSKKGLYKLYLKHCNPQGLLSRQSLAALMVRSFVPTPVHCFVLCAACLIGLWVVRALSGKKPKQKMEYMQCLF